MIPNRAGVIGSGVGSRESGVGVRDPRSESRDSKFETRGLAIGFRFSSFEFRISSFEFRRKNSLARLAQRPVSRAARLAVSGLAGYSTHSSKHMRMSEPSPN